jgi:hypothetical protein
VSLNPWLLAAGSGLAAAALLHLACIVVGADLYRYMGAGERMARMVERGALAPHLITLAITTVLAAISAYAFSASGLLRPLPFTRAVLSLATVALLVRGLVIAAPSLLRRPDLSPAFITNSSLIVLVLGLLLAAGLWTRWNELGA